MKNPESEHDACKLSILFYYLKTKIQKNILNVSMQVCRWAVGGAVILI